MEEVSYEKLANVFEFKYNNEIAWVYSIMDKDQNLFKYYTLTYEDQIPVIKDAINLIRTLQEQKIKLNQIYPNTPEFTKFLSTKKYAEKIRKIYEQEETKKRHEF